LTYQRSAGAQIIHTGWARNTGKFETIHKRLKKIFFIFHFPKIENESKTFDSFEGKKMLCFFKKLGRRNYNKK